MTTTSFEVNGASPSASPATPTDHQTAVAALAVQQQQPHSPPPPQQQPQPLQQKQQQQQQQQPYKKNGEAWVRSLSTGELEQLRARGKDGQTPLHFAATSGNEAMLRLAYERLGRSESVGWFDLRDLGNRVALHLAVWNLHHGCAQFLLEIGVERDVQEKGGYTPLYFAVYRKSPDLVRLLLRHGCNCAIPSFPKESLLTPLNQACILGNIEVVRLLLGQKRKGGEDAELRRTMTECAKKPPPPPPPAAAAAATQAEDSRHKTNCSSCSSCSCSSNNGDSTGEFERQRQELFINARDAHGNTPLINAIRNRHRGVVELLLRSGAHPAIADSRHLNTPLHLAANAGLQDYVELLLPRLTAEQLSLENRSRCTALDLARTNDNQPLIQYLLANGCGEQQQQQQLSGAAGEGSEGDDEVGKGEGEEGTECPICSDLLFLPCELPCGHAFCLYCATKSVRPECGNLCPFRCERRLPDGAEPEVSPDRERRVRERRPAEYQKREAVFCKQRANANLRVLSAHLGREEALRFTESNTCEIRHGPAETQQQSATPETAHAPPPPMALKVALLGRELYVYHVLLKQLPDTPVQRLAVLSLVAEANCLGAEVSGGSISVLTNGELVIALSAQLALAKDTALREIVAALARCAQGWRARLDALLSTSARNDATTTTTTTAEDPTIAAANRLVKAAQQIAVVSELPAPAMLSERVGTTDKAMKMVGLLQAQLAATNPQNQQQSAIGPALAFDGNNTWQLKNAKIALSIRYEARSDRLYVYSPVWNGLPKQPRQRSDLLERLLQLGLFFASGLPNGGAGVDFYGDAVLLHCALPLGGLPTNALALCFPVLTRHIVNAQQVINAALFPTQRGGGGGSASSSMLLNVLLETARDATAAHRCPVPLEDADQFAGALHAGALEWAFLASPRNALWLALIVVTDPLDRALKHAQAAHASLLQAGFCTMVLAGRRASLAAVLHAFNFIWALALAGRVGSVHLLFCGRGGLVVADDGVSLGAVDAFLLDGRRPLPLGVVRRFAESLTTAAGGVGSAQVVVDATADRSETAAAAAAAEGPQSTLAERVFLSSFAFLQGYTPLDVGETWAGLPPKVWALVAGGEWHERPSGEEGAEGTHLTPALYREVASSLHGNPTAGRAAKLDLSKGLHLSSAADMPPMSNDRDKAFPCDLEQLISNVRRAVASTGFGGGGRVVSLHCHRDTLRLRPFSEGMPVCDDIVRAEFAVRPVIPAAPAEMRQQEGETEAEKEGECVEVLAGRMHGIVQGQRLVLLEPQRRKRVAAQGTVVEVGNAWSRVRVARGTLQPGATYRAETIDDVDYECSEGNWFLPSQARTDPGIFSRPSSLDGQERARATHARLLTVGPVCGPAECGWAAGGVVAPPSHSYGSVVFCGETRLSALQAVEAVSQLSPIATCRARALHDELAGERAEDRARAIREAPVWRREWQGARLPRDSGDESSLHRFRELCGAMKKSTPLPVLLAEHEAALPEGTTRLEFRATISRKLGAGSPLPPPDPDNHPVEYYAAAGFVLGDAESLQAAIEAAYKAAERSAAEAFIATAKATLALSALEAYPLLKESGCAAFMTEVASANQFIQAITGYVEQRSADLGAVEQVRLCARLSLVLRAAVCRVPRPKEDAVPDSERRPGKEAGAELSISEAALLGGAEVKAEGQQRRYTLQLGPCDSERDCFRLGRLVQRLRRALEALRVPHGPPLSCCPARLNNIRVLVQHQRSTSGTSAGNDCGETLLIHEEELCLARFHLCLPEPVQPGDIVRLTPYLAPGSAAERCYIHLYDFLPSGGVVLLDRAPITLQAKESSRFPGTGAVVDWQKDFLSWKEAGTGEEVTVEHFKLFVSTHDVTPVQLMKHRFEETPRAEGEQVEWCAFTASFYLMKPEGHETAGGERPAKERIAESEEDDTVQERGVPVPPTTYYAHPLTPQP